MSVCVGVQDKHTPKTYSSENNMDPGTVPQELLVSYFNNIH